MAKEVSPVGVFPPFIKAHEQQVADALTMLDYAVSAGVKAADGHTLSHDIIAKIEETASKLGLFDANSADKSGDAATRATLSAEDWADFDLAYYDLATSLAPVTAETLRNTAGKPPGSRTTTEFLLGDSPAAQFTRGFWCIVGVIIIYILGANIYLACMAEQSKPADYFCSRTALEMITPWAYGALGACVYLLRSAHVYMYQRTFDVRRKPEYFNRILLGTIAGGAIILFTNNIAGDDGTLIQLGSGALGFLAGYNTDLLFNAMERVTNALLPKLGIETVQKAGTTAKPVDINTLIEQTLKAKDIDKDHLKALTAHLTGMRKGS
jgi:hypothetical protein